MNISILLISGSTRDGSTNTAAIRAAASGAPPAIQCRIYDGMTSLPHFNPDDEELRLPDVARELRDQIERADAVLISTPEYAGAMPGALKNLLEWTIGAPIGDGSLYSKPMGWINVSPRPNGARTTYESLRIVLGYAHADLVESACATIPVPRAMINEDGVITDADTTARIVEVVVNLADHARERRGSRSTELRAGT